MSHVCSGWCEPTLGFCGIQSRDYVGRYSEMRYFRYGMLNSLRVALFLTFSWQRVTVFHFFMLMLPASLVGIAISLGSSSTDRLIAVVLAIGVGLGLGWGIPRVLWKILQAALNQGWLFRNGEAPNEPAMTPLQYSERYARWRRAYAWYSGLCVVTLASALAGLMAADNEWLERHVAATILYSTSFGLMVLVVVFTRCRRHLAAKYDLVCPTCRVSIAEGEHGVGEDGYVTCSNCGRRLVLAL